MLLLLLRAAWLMALIAPTRAFLAWVGIELHSTWGIIDYVALNLLALGGLEAFIRREHSAYCRRIADCLIVLAVVWCIVLVGSAVVAFFLSDGSWTDFLGTWHDIRIGSIGTGAVLSYGWYGNALIPALFNLEPQIGATPDESLDWLHEGSHSGCACGSPVCTCPGSNGCFFSTDN